MTQTKALAEAALKDDYQPAVREQLVNSWFLLAQIENNQNSVEGIEAVFAAHVERNSGIGARAELGTLPTAGRQRYVNLREPVTYDYGAFSISGPAIEASQSDKGSFLRLLEAENKGLVADVKKDMARKVWNPASKAIATVNGVVTASPNVVVDASRNVWRTLVKGAVLDIGTVGDEAGSAAGVVIDSVDRGTNTIVLTTSVTLADNDIITRAGTLGDEMIGVQEIVSDTGVLHGINPATEDVWKSTVNDNGGTPRAITEVLLETFLDDIMFESDQSPNLMATTAGVQRSYANLLQQDRRYTQNPVSLKGGFSALSVSVGNIELAMAVDYDCPDGEIYALNTDHLEYMTMGAPWRFMDRDGSVLDRVPGQDAYQAVLFCYHNLVTDQRNAHGKLDDITES